MKKKVPYLLCLAAGILIGFVPFGIQLASSREQAYPISLKEDLAGNRYMLSGLPWETPLHEVTSRIPGGILKVDSEIAGQANYQFPVYLEDCRSEGEGLMYLAVPPAGQGGDPYQEPCIRTVNLRFPYADWESCEKALDAVLGSLNSLREKGWNGLERAAEAKDAAPEEKQRFSIQADSIGIVSEMLVNAQGQPYTDSLTVSVQPRGTEKQPEGWYLRISLAQVFPGALR